MDNTGLPEKSENFSVAPVDEIPEAVRETKEPKSSSGSKPVLLILGGIGLSAIALLVASAFFSSRTLDPEVVSSPKPVEKVQTVTTKSEPDNLLGHLPYNEAPESELQSVTPDNRIRLRIAAAKKFQQMVAAARKDGVQIQPISGFRSISEQQYLFFDIKEQRAQGATKRAEVSAPPGYSEHHTGYSVDLGDRTSPTTNLSPSFEKTAAFAWLEKNAARYSFELSFPRDNPQGVSYEPWHWRFVGDRDSLETFYKAKNWR